MNRFIHHRVNRRSALLLMRSAATALLVGCLPRKISAASSQTTPGCVVRPQQTEGPYFVDEKLNRSDIRSDSKTGLVRAGVPLRLNLRVTQVNDQLCTPVKGAIVDIWHCDASGIYSDVADPRFDTKGQNFLRGYQTTDASGNVQFLTIYPGWYPGRTVHIHFKIRTASEQSHEFTSQLYFDDAISDRVYAQEPYAKKGARSVRNDRDGIFQQGGTQLLLSLSPIDQGYAATFELGLQKTS
ncbi:intradiol ring-cleavage dioxygenase [Phormidesmis sp. 146-12]